MHRAAIPAVTDAELDLYCRYYNLLIEWNERFNLVSRGSLQNAFSAHFVDSIHIADVARRQSVKRIVDLGSGAGFPGAVISIRLGAPVLLFERTGKKRAFLQEIATSLNLGLTILEEFRLQSDPILLTARAVMPPAELLRDLRRKVLPGSTILIPTTTDQTIIYEKKSFQQVERFEYELPLSAAKRAVSVFLKRCLPC